VFALTVADASRVVSVAATVDGERDGKFGARKLSMQRSDIRRPFRFGVPKQREFFGDTQAHGAFDDAAARLRVLGGVAVDIDMTPLSRVAALLYEGPWVAERHAAIRAFFDARPDAIDPTVRSIIAGAARFDATDVFAAFAGLEAMQRATAYTIADVLADPVTLNQRMGTYTNFVNLLDWAAIAVPSSIRDDGLPSGITLIGPAGSDVGLASLAQRYHAATGLPLGATGTAQSAAEPLTVAAGVVRIAVVGAHLSGLPLNHELTSRGGRLLRTARTAPAYRLFRLPNTQPPKPGLVRVRERTSCGIELEIWELDHAGFGDFVSRIPSPLGIGAIELDDGSRVQGFLCESSATTGAEDITGHGGWRNYLGQRVAAA
jgi:allophanate hydrolase